MAFVDMTLNELRDYLPARAEPADFDTFWAATLAEARAFPLDARFEPVASRLSTVEVEDVTFAGFGGQPVKGWLLRPAHATGPLPTVVEYVGYGGGRGLPHERLVWASAGYAHLTMDTRGQGSAWQVGDTPDEGPAGNSHPGFTTRGVLDRDTYYYRRLYTDAVRALEAARTHPSVDPARVLVAGGSQGGGIALAVAGLAGLAGLSGDLAGVVTDVPFMQHIRHATEITDGYPYKEIAEFCKVHRDKVERVFETISYADGLNFAARATAPALYSVALMDEICPPSTVFASFNHYAGPKEIEVYPYNGHEGGGAHQVARALEFAASMLG
jgi:cephalosporin-C deacetylase